MSFIEKLRKGMQSAPYENEQPGNSQEPAGEETFEDGTAVFASYKTGGKQEQANPVGNGSVLEESAVKKRGRPKKINVPDSIEEATGQTDENPETSAEAQTKDHFKKTFPKTMATKRTLIPDNQNDSNWLNGDGQLTVNVFQTENELVLQSAIAGVKVEELDVIIEDDVITIKGDRPNPLAEAGDYFIEECYWGPFSRKVILPVEVDSSRADAAMKEGILTIRIPKIQREKKKKLTIKE